MKRSTRGPEVAAAREPAEVQRRSEAVALSPPPCGILLADAPGSAVGRATPVQRALAGGARGEDTRAVQRAALAGVRGPGTRLPHFAAVQRAFVGHDLGGVRAFTDARAAGASRAIGAEAYTVGRSVAFASAHPSLHTVAHEAAHVVQQQSGVRLKGGVGQVGDPYERNAEAVADAVVAGRPIPGILGGPGGGGEAVQRRSAVGEFVEQQRALMAMGRQALPRKYTTVGFEFEFATMVDGSAFTGLSHVELGKTEPMPDPEVPFYFETDASNALELVTPPFWLPTIDGEVLPEPDAVETVIDLFKERLAELTDEDGMTIGRLADTMGRDDAIALALQPVVLRRENLTPKTPATVDLAAPNVTAETIADIEVTSITKFGGGIDAQANVATDAFGFDLISEAFEGDRFSETDDSIGALTRLERRIVNVLYRYAFKPMFGWKAQKTRFTTAERLASEFLDAAHALIERGNQRFRARLRELDDVPGWLEEYLLTELPAQVKQLEQILTGTHVARLGTRSVTRFGLHLISAAIDAQLVAISNWLHDTDAWLDERGVPVDATFGPEQIEAALAGLEGSRRSAQAAVAEVPQLGAENPGLRTFLDAVARTMAGQLAVGSIDVVRQAQEARERDPQARMGGADGRGILAHQYMSSRVKDVSGVWAKAPALDIGLGLLSFAEWKTVDRMFGDRDFQAALGATVLDVDVGGVRFAADAVRPLVLGVAAGIRRFIADHRLIATSWGRQVVGDAARKALSVTPQARPAFMTHDPALATPRQDTFVPLQHVQMPEVWPDKSRQFVAEFRTKPVEKLRKIKDWRARR
jgi:hypothetical protein